MAHVHAFGDVAPAAKPFIHLGATSAFVTDNADLILMRRGLDLLRGRLIAVLRALAAFAREWRDEPTLGYTHLQPAQLTTVGKRATLWMQDLVLDLMDLDYRRATLPFRGVKGTTGTQASFLQLFDGDHERVRELDRRVTAAMDFTHSLAVTGQTYTRKLDAQVLGVVAGVAASCGEVQRATCACCRRSARSRSRSSPSRSARRRWRTSGTRCAPSASRRWRASSGRSSRTRTRRTRVQYFERTLDDSANRRLVIPESFLATDAILILMVNVASGLEVHPARIRQRVTDELPFMATEELIVRAVRAGGDRQEAHEVIRRHSVAAARAMKDGGKRNDMLDRLAGDPEFGVPIGRPARGARPATLRRARAEQVDEFLDEIVDPLLAGTPAVDLRDVAEVRV